MSTVVIPGKADFNFSDKFRKHRMSLILAPIFVVDLKTDKCDFCIFKPLQVKNMGNRKPIFLVIFMALAGMVVIFSIYFWYDSEPSNLSAKNLQKEYMITGNTAIFKVEVRESGGHWQLLAEGLKSRKECDKIIDQDFNKRKR